MQVRAHIVAGPIKGATYILQPGDNTIGRTSGCSIVLTNPQLSKRHAMITVGENKVELVDLGSSNGSFVNGVLVKKKTLQNGDKISMGPFVLEMIISNPARHLPAVTSAGGLASMQGASGLLSATAGFGQNGEVAATPMNLSAPEPKSLLAKMIRRFDEIALPVLFELNKSYDWLTIVVSLFLGFIVINMALTVFPLMDAAKESVLRETISKAVYIAKQITTINAPALSEGAESKLDVSFTEVDINVVSALIVNLEGRIQAPGSRLNEVYNDTAFLRYRDKIKLGDQTKWTTHREVSDSGMVTVLDPIMILSRARGINVPGAVSVVKYSTSGSSLDKGTVSVVYLEALVMSGLIGAIFIYLLYHFSMNPIRTLNDDIDAVLKGNSDVVAKRFQFESLDKLIDSVNAALSRIPRADGDASARAVATDESQASFDTLLRLIESLGPKLKSGIILLDAERKIKYINSSFEETSGIHLANAAGEPMDSACRDEALASLMRELIENSRSAGNAGMEDSFEFGSGTHKINCTAVIGSTNQVDAYFIFVEKEES